MIICNSSLEGSQTILRTALDILKPLGFCIGGAKSNDHAYLDKGLDEGESKAPNYYLRIPIYSSKNDVSDLSSTVMLGTPFIIRHEYYKGNDPHTTSGLVTASMNQFQTPIKSDNLPIDDKWVIKAKDLLRKIEEKWSQNNTNLA